MNLNIFYSLMENYENVDTCYLYGLPKRLQIKIGAFIVFSKPAPLSETPFVLYREKGMEAYCRVIIIRNIRRDTLRPNCSSFSDRRISFINKFMRSHSWIATITYGVCSSTRVIMSVTLKGSGTLSIISSKDCLT